MKYLTTMAILFAGSFTAQVNANPVINVLNVQTDDPTAYTNYIANNTEIMKSLGAVSGGTCVTLTGHKYPNQAFAWTIYPKFNNC